MTSKFEIREWLDGARGEGPWASHKGATHVIVACDTFDNSEFGVFVMPDDDVHKHIKRLSWNALFLNPSDCMTRVMEVYAMHLDIEAQLAEPRAWHVSSAPQHHLLKVSNGTMNLQTGVFTKNDGTTVQHKLWDPVVDDSRSWLVKGLREASREADINPELRERVAANPSGFIHVEQPVPYPYLKFRRRDV